MAYHAAAGIATRDRDAVRYQRHRPEQTLLYRIVAEYYPAFTAHDESEQQRFKSTCCALTTAAGVLRAGWRERCRWLQKRGRGFSDPGSIAAGFGEVLHSCRTIRRQSSAVGLG